MKPKLYKAVVTLSVAVVIHAEEPPSETDWRDAAREDIAENWGLLPPPNVSGVVEVASVADLPPQWENAIPYGDNGDWCDNRTCKEHLAGDGGQG